LAITGGGMFWVEKGLFGGDSRDPGRRSPPPPGGGGGGGGGGNLQEAVGIAPGVDHVVS